MYDEKLIDDIVSAQTAYIFSESKDGTMIPEVRRKLAMIALEKYDAYRAANAGDDETIIDIVRKAAVEKYSEWKMDDVPSKEEIAFILSELRHLGWGPQSVTDCHQLKTDTEEEKKALVRRILDDPEA